MKDKNNRMKDKNNRYRRWLALTLGLSLAALGLLGGTVAAVDPFFHFHGPLSGLAYPIDNERYQNDGISRSFSYDAVLTGTSMTENFKASLFDSQFGVQSIKIPFAGGYYREVDEAVRRALDYNPGIRLVLRSLDGNFLICDKDQWNKDAPRPEYLYDKNPWNDVKYLFDKDVLLGNVAAVFERTRAGLATTTFDEYMHWAPDKEWGREAVLKTYERMPRAGEEQVFTDQDRRMVEENIKQNVLATAKANPQVTFYYFFPPYSIAYWDSEIMAGNKLEYYLAAQRLAADMLLECGNIRLFAFDDQHDILCDLDNYMDVIHYSEEVGDQILRWMAAGEHQLNVENVDAYFREIGEFYRGYDYEEIYQ